MKNYKEKYHEHEWYPTRGGDKEMCAWCPETRPVKAATQRQLILNQLRQKDVCGNTLLEQRIPRYAARIHELRKEGFTIVSRPCKQHAHSSNVFEYILAREPMKWGSR